MDAQSVTYYEVRFVYYKYNSGRGDNGEYVYTHQLQKLEDAQSYAKLLSENLNNSEWLYEELYIDGYVKAVKGIWEITERKM